VHTAVVIPLKVHLLYPLPSHRHVAVELSEVWSCPLAACVGRRRRSTRAWYPVMSRSADTRPITNEPHDRRGGVVRQPRG
jgi:hypothetical protein